MAHRTLLTDRQQVALFDLAPDEASLLRHYTRSDDDLEIVRARRHPHNRFAFVPKLCALRYPGQLLVPEGVIPLEVTRPDLLAEAERVKLYSSHNLRRIDPPLSASPRRVRVNVTKSAQL